MTITARARYTNGQLIPLEPLIMEEEAEVVDGNRKRQAGGCYADSY